MASGLREVRVKAVCEARAVDLLARIIVGFFLVGVLAGTTARPEPQRHEFTRLLMGVDVRIIVWSEDPSAARTGAAAAFDRIAAIEDVASDWRPSSEVMRLCASGPDRDIPLSHDLYAMLEAARRVSFASGGAFDVTIGPLTHLWREARQRGGEPTPEQIAGAAARVGFRHLTLDHEGRTARLSRSGMVIDLGGIAQGYAAAEAMEAMDAAGLGSACVDVSGDIVVGDPPPGAIGWRVAVPGAEGWRTLTLTRCAVSTSGDQEQFVISEGERESHILLPLTGRGVVGMRSVTVIAADAMLADALATAITAMGSARGLELAERIPGLEAGVITQDGAGVLHEEATSGFPGA